MKKILRPLPVQIDAGSAMPVYEQIKHAIKLAIVSGQLQENEQLPPIRELAANLQINANTIVKVYYQLDVEGFIYSRVGQGYFARAQAVVDKQARQPLFKALTDDYIAKSVHIGYSLTDIAAEIALRKHITLGKESRT
jgi:GntR family transcriptional regulator